MSTTRKIFPIVLATSLAVLPAAGAYAQSTAGSANANATATANANQNSALLSDSARGVAAVEAELRARGYVITKESRTLLGRYKLRAESDTDVRVVVVHQSSGEVLSDVIVGTKRAEEAGANVKANGQASAAQQNRDNNAGSRTTVEVSGGGSGNGSGSSSGGGASVDVSVGVSAGGSGSASSGGGSSSGSAGGSASGSAGGGLGIGN